MEKRDQKFDPRVQPGDEKWSFYTKYGCDIGFFQKKPDFDPRDSASKILINPKNDEKMLISNDFLQKLPGWRKMVIR
jgi:hypothetical protein